MALKDYRFDGSKKLNLAKLPTDSKKDHADKDEIKALTEKNLEKMAELQNRFYADGREGLVIVLQALDAAGKDSTIKHVMGGVNPQGIHVYSFKTPTKTELAHDYLWRVNQCLPERGMISLFNRSYYEDVLVVKVDRIDKCYHMAPRVLEDPAFFEKRYRQIRDYEQYLYENSYRVLKIFLNVSMDKQKERFIERIDVPEKNWKFSAGDLDVRLQWKEYREAIEDAVNETSTPESPWYVLPADQKWYTRYLVTEAFIKTMEEIDPQYPELDEETKANLGTYKEALERGDYDLKKGRKAKK